MLELVIQLLDKAIYDVMCDFKRHGVAAKQMNQQGNQEETEKIHATMADILQRLSPVKERVHFLYPEYIELFDLLTNKKIKIKDGK